MSHKRFAAHFALAALVAAGCGGDDRQDTFVEESPDTYDDTSAPITQELTTQITEFRAEVEATMNMLAADIRDLQVDLREDQREHWQELSERMEENEIEVRENLARMGATEADEARSARSDAAENLAELEAEVTRAEMELAADSRELLDRAEQRLSLLESDLAEIERQVATHTTAPAPPVDPQPGAAPMGQAPQTAPHAANGERVEELRGEIGEARLELMRLSQASVDSEELEDARESIPETIAELTREVRETWYDARWNGQPVS
jgi:DNA repair exonuclease SbcCD ATPase subunit